MEGKILDCCHKPNPCHDDVLVELTKERDQLIDWINIMIDYFIKNVKVAILKESIGYIIHKLETGEFNCLDIQEVKDLYCGFLKYNILIDDVKQYENFHCKVLY